MRAFILAAMLVASFSIASVGAQTTAAHYSTAETDIGTLLDDPAAVPFWTSTFLALLPTHRWRWLVR